jgi:hypothetical protein
VGSRSPLARQRATGVLAMVAGGSVRVLPDCDHLACLDAPQHPAAAVTRRRVGPAPRPGFAPAQWSTG